MRFDRQVAVPRSANRLCTVEHSFELVKRTARILLYRHSQLDHVVWRVDQILLGAQVTLGCLNRRVAQQQLNLFKLATTSTAQFGARATVMSHAA
jgi:hypothetical protein